jgi:SagB-type dehydrogenase family enzyme
MFPVYKGTYERGDDLKSDYPNRSSSYRDHVIAWSKDLGRSIDYLATRPEIDSGKLAYEGVSWGASLGCLLRAVEDRIKVCVPLVPGFYLQKCLPESDQLNFAPRVKVPVLMLNGHFDFFYPPPASTARTFGEVVRTRRSALDFQDRNPSMSLAQLSANLDAAARRFSADFAWTRFIQLYLYVHRVDGLEPGVYRHWMESGELEMIRSGDQRVAAAGLSLGQDLAGNACVAFSMIADIDRAVRIHGDRGYRYVHFEAGAIGQRLYLAAEALGLRATGIGAFFDNEVHRYLNLVPDQGQVVYHFAIGYPVPDPRLEA